MKSDYLAKYTGKSKKTRRAKSNVVVDSDDSLAVALDDEEPVRVESKFKGFKRIDNTEAPKTIPQTEQRPQPLQPQQTVYRDLSGRVVDISSVQLAKTAPKETIVKNSDDIPATSQRSFTASKYDTEYNAVLRARKHFEDPLDVPAAAPTESRYGGFFYQGASPANRFGARAGVMWDGVDRSNGFEKLVVRKRDKQTFDKMELKFLETYEMDYE